MRLKKSVISFLLLVGFSTVSKATVSGLQATSDATNAYYQYTYSGTPTYLQVFLDTDQKSSTGYRNAGIGAEYLIENGVLAKYTGDGSSWSWSIVKNVSLVKTSTTAKWTIARSDLGNPPMINVVGQTSPPVSDSPILSQSFVSTSGLGISALSATSDSANASYQFSYTGSPALFQVFLDTDQSSSSGYPMAGIGADYLIENGNLYRYTGSAGSWAWTLVKSVAYSNSNSTASFTLSRADLGSPSALKAVGRVCISTIAAAVSAVVSQVLSSVAPAPAPAPVPSGSVSQVNFSANTAFFPNPERGFYYMSDCNSQITASQLQTLKNMGHSLTMCSFHLDAFINTAISQAALDLFDKNMAAIRTAGMKALVRFSYSSDTAGVDATLSQVKYHLDQLAPYLAKNKDVIAVVQSGFIGGWGEWAYSQHFGTGLVNVLSAQNLADRKSVIDKLLATVPVDRMLQIRYPAHKMVYYGNSPLASTEAFSGSAKARIGHHNDCFLAGPTDWGTYINASTEYPYLASETQYLPMGGETCNPNPPRSDCPTALKELSMFHWSFMNEGYHQTVIANFKTQGCFDQIKSSLGYRFVMSSGSFSTSAKVGGSISVGLNLQNKGFSSPYNSRKLELILRNNSTGSIYRVALNGDPRTWLPGQAIAINQVVALPSSIPAGSYSLLLNLPDPEPSLYSRPEYSIQLANSNVWEASTGFNKLNANLTVSP